MATPFDVITKHRRHAWLCFLLIALGFIALCVGTTVWHALQRNHPPVAQKYMQEPVQLGDISICLTNEFGFFPINISDIIASCQIGSAFTVPATQQLATQVSLGAKPNALGNQAIFSQGVTSFTANAPSAGCAVSQSFRTDVLGAIPKNCFRYNTAGIGFQTNTSVTLALGWQAPSYASSTNSSDPTYSIPLGSQAVLALFTDGLNSNNAFEMSYQGLNNTNNVQLQPSVRKNLKKFPNGNFTETFANPETTPFIYAAVSGSFLSNARTYVQLVITTTPKGYLQITEQDPLSPWTLLPAYGGFWPYFIVVFGLFFTAEPDKYIRPFIVRWSSSAWGKVMPPAERAQSTQPMTLGTINSSAPSQTNGMSESERKERAYMGGMSDSERKERQYMDGMSETERKERAYMAAQHDKLSSTF